jgi:4,5-DOPA dioxygenase extradiol
MTKMPVLFIGHGSPMNIIADNAFTRHLNALGKHLPRPAAIMVISAHWLTSGTEVGCQSYPKTIHDFYGFPSELYKISYSCPGVPGIASKIAQQIKNNSVKCNNEWGLDHGSWSVLKHLYPAADIPVFEMSLDYSFNEWHPKSLRYHYDLAAELAWLREIGVLIIGSGNLVHNLNLVDFENMDAAPPKWAVEIDNIIKNKLKAGDHKALIDYQNLSPDAHLAVPTLDHYLPMIYALALKTKSEKITFSYEGFQNASISMRCFKID